MCVAKKKSHTPHQQRPETFASSNVEMQSATGSFTMHMGGDATRAGAGGNITMHVVDKILDVHDETGSKERLFLVSWEGYGSEEDSWETRENLPPAMIKEFLHQNGLYDYEWPISR